MKEVKKFENNLLDRVEYTFESNVSSTPSRQDVKAEVVKKLKADENLVSIESVKSHYGSRKVHVIAYVYTSEDAMKSLVAKHIAKRNEAPVAEAEE